MGNKITKAKKDLIQRKTFVLVHSLLYLHRQIHEPAIARVMVILNNNYNYYQTEYDFCHYLFFYYFPTISYTEAAVAQ